MKKLMMLALGIVLLVGSLPGAASPGVREKLEGFEWRAEQFDWRDAVPELSRIAAAPEEPLYVRKRAVAALGKVNGDSARQVLANLIQGNEPLSLRRRAVDVLCPGEEGDLNSRALEPLLEALRSGNQQLRHRAALCLVQFTTLEEVARAIDVYVASASSWELKAIEDR